MENWQTMPMMHPERIPHRRIDIMRVYVPNRERLHSSNRCLERATVVHFGPNVNKRNAQHRLANTLATQLNYHPKDFLIGKADPGEGDLMAIFSTETMRNHAVHVGVFAIDYDSHVQLAKWKQSERMIYDPTSHKARLTLENVPYDNWNEENLEQLLSGVGHVLRMAPIMVNGNFETLRVLVACHNPVNIPPTLLMSTHPFSTTVIVNLDGWLHVPAENLPPPRGDQIFRNPPRRDNRPPSPRAMRQPSESSDYSRAITDEYAMGASSTYSRKTHQSQ